MSRIFERVPNIAILLMLLAGMSLCRADSASPFQRIASESPRVHRWYPLPITSRGSNQVRLPAGQSVQCQVPGHSGLHVQVDGDIQDVRVGSIQFTQYQKDISQARVEVRPRYTSPSTLEIYSEPGLGHTYELTNISESPIQLSCYQLTRIHAGTYWQRMTELINSLSTQEFLRELRSLNCNDPGIPFLIAEWTRMIADHTDFSEITSQQLECMKSIYLHVMAYGQLLESEGTVDEYLELPGTLLEIAGEEGVVFDGIWSISVEGPALVLLPCRVLWSDDFREYQSDLKISLDGISLLDKPIDFRQNVFPTKGVIQDPRRRKEGTRDESPEANPLVSNMEHIHVYVPEGTHELCLQTQSSIWVSPLLRKIIFPSATGNILRLDSSHPEVQTYLNPSMLRVLLAPLSMGQTVHFDELANRLKMNMDDRFIDYLSRNAANRLETRSLDVHRVSHHDVESLEILDTGFTISPVIQHNLDFSMAGTPFYRMDSDTEYLINVTADQGEHVVVVPFVFDPDSPGTRDLTMFVNDREYPLTGMRDPNRSKDGFSIRFAPGQHTIRAVFDTPDVWCQWRILDARTQQLSSHRYLYRRGYTRVTNSIEYYAELPSEWNGQIIRCIFRPEPETFSEPVTLSFSWGAGEREITFIPAGIPAGCEFIIPGGTQKVHFTSSDTGWINISSQGEKLESRIEYRVGDPEVLKMYAEFLDSYFSLPSGVKPGNTGDHQQDMDVLEEFLSRYIAGDFRRCETLYLESTDLHTGWMGELNRLLLLFKLEHYNRIRTDGPPIFEALVPHQDWLLRLLMYCSVAVNDVEGALTYAADLVRRWPDDLMAGYILSTNWAGIQYSKPTPYEHGASRTNNTDYTISAELEFPPGILQFNSLPSSQYTFSGDMICLSDQLEDGRKEHYMLLNQRSVLECSPNGPMILRLPVRRVFARSIESIDPAILNVEWNNEFWQIPLTETGLARKSLAGPDGFLLGALQYVYIPLRDGRNDIRVSCENGSVAARLMVESNPDQTEYRTDQAEIYRMCTRAMQTHRQHTWIQTMIKLEKHLQENPDNLVYTNLRRLISPFLDWRSIRTLNSPLGAQWLTESLIDESETELDDSRTTIQFALPDGAAWQCELELSPVRSINHMDVSVSIDNRVLAKLTADQSTWTGIIPANTGGILSLTLLNVNPMTAIHPTVTIRRGGRCFELTPIRRFRTVKCRTASPATAHVFGPTILKCQVRQIGDLTGAQVSVTMTHTPSGTVDHRQLSVESIPDQFVHTGSPGVKVSLPVSANLVLDQPGEYTIRFEPVGESGMPCLIRVSGCTENNWPDKWSAVTEPLALTGICDEELEGQPDVVDTWNSGVPDHLPLHSQAGSTWDLGLGYRYRNQDPDDDIDLFTSDGMTLEAGNAKRWEGTGIWTRWIAGGTKTESNQPILSLQGDYNWYSVTGDYHYSLAARGHGQNIDGSTEYSGQIRLGVRRRVDLTPRITVIPGVTAIGNFQSLDPTDVSALDDPPDPLMFSHFADRHQFGVNVRTQVNVQLLRNLRGYTRFTALSAGDHESGVLGVWWLTAGFKSMIGPVSSDVYYLERDSFGTTREPNRSRVGVEIETLFAVSRRVIVRAYVQDRFTFDNSLNDIQAGFRLHFNAGRLLRDFDPHQLTFYREWEDHLVQ